MSDRINSIIVTLERDMRDDDSEAIQRAISQLRGVLSVHTNVSDISTHVAYQRAYSDLEAKLWEALRRKD